VIIGVNIQAIHRPRRPAWHGEIFFGVHELALAGDIKGRE
jgi:hypothetical protein